MESKSVFILLQISYAYTLASYLREWLIKTGPKMIKWDNVHNKMTKKWVLRHPTWRCGEHFPAGAAGNRTPRSLVVVFSSSPSSEPVSIGSELTTGNLNEHTDLVFWPNNISTNVKDVQLCGFTTKFALSQAIYLFAYALRVNHILFLFVKIL